MAAYTDSYIVSDDISQITYRIQKNESDRARFSFVLRRERDSRAPTSLRSPTSNALLCHGHPGQASISFNRLKAKELYRALFCIYQLAYVSELSTQAAIHKKSRD